MVETSPKIGGVLDRITSFGMDDLGGGGGAFSWAEIFDWRMSKKGLPRMVCHDKDYCKACHHKAKQQIRQKEK